MKHCSRCGKEFDPKREVFRLVWSVGSFTQSIDDFCSDECLREFVKKFIVEKIVVRQQTWDQSKVKRT